MKAYCLSGSTKVLLSNAFLDDTVEVTRPLVIIKALVEAHRVQRHLGYCRIIHTFAITLSQTLPSLNVCHIL